MVKFGIAIGAYSSGVGAAGPVEACADRIRAFVEAGVDYVVLAPVCGSREWSRQLAAYGELLAELGAART
jgi:alkanesulfonate monooxygenase SsuD/methylene tetrahydromethanopterin reductase-like flavin-dependent oxidoreductase (luciferase family)